MTAKLLQIICGQCQGRMRVERTGGAVECPHCNAHLTIPPEIDFGGVAPVATPGLEATVTAPVDVADDGGVDIGVTVIDPTPDESRSAATTKTTRPDAGSTDAGTPATVSRQMFLILAGYACAVTISLAWVLLTRGSSSNLESLPDIRPLADGEFQFVGFDAELPPNHTLALGESRRYGAVRVTPLRVTREPIEFTHFRTAATRPETAPVLKLWLEFENVTDDMKFPPWDLGLMTLRAPFPNDPIGTRANTFLCRSGADRAVENLGFNYDHPGDSEWDLKGFGSGNILGPHETQLSWVASSEEDVSRLTDRPGELRWRVQFRKGVHRDSGHGVTTLIEVAFSTDDIKTPDADETEDNSDAATSG